MCNLVCRDWWCHILIRTAGTYQDRACPCPVVLVGEATAFARRFFFRLALEENSHSDLQRLHALKGLHLLRLGFSFHLLSRFHTIHQADHLAPGTGKVHLQNHL